MPRKFAIEYVDQLLEDVTYSGFTELSTAICSSRNFKSALPDYGLSQFAFLFVEALLWFSQAARSGVWTYHEVTPQARQDAMAIALHEFGAQELASWYERGTRDWRSETKVIAVDV